MKKPRCSVSDGYRAAPARRCSHAARYVSKLSWRCSDVCTGSAMTATVHTVANARAAALLPVKLLARLGITEGNVGGEQVFLKLLLTRLASEDSQDLLRLLQLAELDARDDGAVVQQGVRQPLIRVLRVQ